MLNRTGTCPAFCCCHSPREPAPPPFGLCRTAFVIVRALPFSGPLHCAAPWFGGKQSTPI